MCFYMATITKRKEPPNMEKKQLLCINFKNLCFFFSLKKLCDHPKLSFRLNIIKFWTKFDNKHGCRLRLQFYLIISDKKKSIVISSIKYLNFEFL